MVHPTHEDLVAERQQDGADEQPEDAGRRHATQRAKQDHRHRRVDATAQHQRLQEVVGHSRDAQHDRVDDGRTRAVVAAHPDVGDGRDGDQQRRYLRDAQHEHDHCEHACKRYLGDHQRDADGDGLDQRHADDALSDGANRGRRQLDELRSALRAHDAREDGLAGACALCAERHDDARDQERREEHQQSAADAGHEVERRFRQVADLRLHFLHERRQVGMRLRPVGVHLLADDRPLRHARAGRRDLQRVVLDGVHVILDRVCDRGHQRRRGCDDQHRSRECDQRGREALPAADPARQHLVQRVQCNGEDQRPDHQSQERREDPVAECREREDQAGANQHVEQHRRFLLVGCGIRRQMLIHLASPSGRPSR